MRWSLLLGLFLGLLLLSIPSGSASAQDSCVVTFDVNNDGISLSVADAVYLMRWLRGDTVAPVNPAVADLNQDCRIDEGDVEEFRACMYGPNYPWWCNKPGGGWPAFSTCCNPDTTRVSCCLTDSCTMRHPDNCLALGGAISNDVPFCQTNPCDCCIGVRGNLDGDPGESVDISDLSCYIDQIFLAIWPPTCQPCFQEADMNNDMGIDISDVQTMIDFIFFGTPLPACP